MQKYRGVRNGGAAMIYIESFDRDIFHSGLSKLIYFCNTLIFF